MKVALVVGHNPRRQGADALAPISSSEFVFWDSLLAKRNRLGRNYSGVDMKVFRRKSGLPYYSEIKECYVRVNEWGADQSIEFHFNAGGGTGTETLSSGTKGSLALCGKLQAAMVGALGLSDRGVKVRRYNDRGGASLWLGRAPAALIEPFFGDNYRDVGRVAEIGEWGLLRAILSIYEKG